MIALVTGASGGLGRYVMEALRARDFAAIGPMHHEMDVTEPHVVREWLANTKPALVIHLAALADVPACAADPERAHRINAAGTSHVAYECGRIGARMIYMSTDAVFGGGGPHAESDDPVPSSPYGRSKHDGEMFVDGLGNDGLVVRANFFTRRCNSKRSFAEYVVAGALTGGPIPCFADVLTTPVFAGTLAEQIVQAAINWTSGALHVGSKDTVNRVEQASLICESYFGFGDYLIEPAAHPGGPTDGRLVGRGIVGTVREEVQKMTTAEPVTCAS